MNDLDTQFLRRAIRLAMNGRGRVEPNPMVGCLIVKAGKVIGEGFHGTFGGPHAEPQALASCTESPEGATAYVTLEPCCHTNKKTPPCAPRLIGARIARVVVGCIDPNPDVNGKGLDLLRQAGIEVISPNVQSKLDHEHSSSRPDRGASVPDLVALECQQLLAPFIARTCFARPYVTLKWAQSADGKVAGAGGARIQISNDRSWRAVHVLRSRSDAILVGVGTVLSDDPLLTARGVEQSRLATRIILDSALRTPPTSRLAQSAQAMPVDLFFTREGFISAGPERIKALMACGIDLISTNASNEGRIAIPKLLAHERFAQITHLLVEPGPKLAAGFFNAGAADRVWVIQSAKALNLPNAPDAPELPSRYIKTGELRLDDDIISEHLDRESDLFFAASPSADFVLLADDVEKQVI